jgi:putative redox protein
MIETVTEFKYKEISAAWDRADGYLGRNATGATISMGKPQAGNGAISPTEAMLFGLAGCTAIDIIDILRKKRQEPADLQVRVIGKQRTCEYPMTFVEFQVEYLLWGDNLKPRDVEQAIKLSEHKYCSVGATLAKSGQIVSTYKILKPGEGAPRE